MPTAWWSAPASTRRGSCSTGRKANCGATCPGADSPKCSRRWSRVSPAKESGVINGTGEVSVVVHRVVHGGERFTEGTLITDEVVSRIEELNPLAPLHNPVNVAGIREMRRLFPAVPHVAVFDTAYHHTLPAHAYLYGLPYEFYEKKGVRRYGFHGSSHQYVGLRASQFLGRRPNELRIVSCHLGNGSSLCAVDHGRSMDTTMGFTPAEGLIMGTRCGDVDAGVLAFLERTDGLTASQSEELLNRKSGLLGLSGISGDMREIQKAAGEGSPRALVALKAYSYRVRKYLGAYVAAMGGLDAVIFTGGIGQGSAEVRALALQGLGCMGITLDEGRNRDARRLRRGVPDLDRRFDRGRARRAHRRRAHDGARSAADARAFPHHARAGGSKAGPVPRRGLGAPYPSDAGARRGAVWPGAPAHQARRPLAARPVRVHRTARRSSARRAASSGCACSGRPGNTPRSKSR